MAFVIKDACIACGACAAECPVSCISSGESIFVIDEEFCVSCGNCSRICPVGAPVSKEV